MESYGPSTMVKMMKSDIFDSIVGVVSRLRAYEQR